MHLFLVGINKAKLFYMFRCLLDRTEVYCRIKGIQDDEGEAG